MGEHIRLSGKKLKPFNSPDEVFTILGVSNVDGIFINERQEGREIKQQYIKVFAGDIVYNPHRVNVGSIGVVPEIYAGGIVSGIYVVFRPKNPEKLPPHYVYTWLKSSAYIDIIKAYDTKGAVRANLSYEQLCRIKIIIPSTQILNEFNKFQAQITEFNKTTKKIEGQKKDYTDGLVNSKIHT